MTKVYPCLKKRKEKLMHNFSQANNIHEKKKGSLRYFFQGVNVNNVVTWILIGKEDFNVEYMVFHASIQPLTTISNVKIWHCYAVLTRERSYVFTRERSYFTALCVFGWLKRLLSPINREFSTLFWFSQVINIHKFLKEINFLFQLYNTSWPISTLL